MRVAMVSEHASPLAALGGADAGGQNVHVAALSAALTRRGAEVTVHTRRDDAELPARVAVAPGYTVEH
ncbi:MAG TPA: glycosyltransferase family 1 protein, partial [Actinomycetes bacterium]|nr:glycosyltransferase family 1 protein [Actinomycetes bacterium]